VTHPPSPSRPQTVPSASAGPLLHGIRAGPPVPPIAGWLTELDKWSRTSARFFSSADRSSSTLPPPRSASPGIQPADHDLGASAASGSWVSRGAEADQLGPSLAAAAQRGDGPSARRRGGRGPRPANTLKGRAGSAGAPRRANLVAVGEPDPPPGNPSPSLMAISTVLGSVSFGAPKVVAGGSIHVYGAPGAARAMAGSMGNARARIFLAARNEAELISIDGYYPDPPRDMDAKAGAAGRPQCWLEDGALSIAALD